MVVPPPYNAFGEPGITGALQPRRAFPARPSRHRRGGVPGGRDLSQWAPELGGDRYGEMEAANRMLRLLHTADVRLGARHEGLGEAAAALRDRQAAAFGAAIDLAIAERVDAVLVSGDLFDANTASRRTVEGAVAALRRLAGARIRAVLLPGGRDAWTRSSVYRAYDLPAMVGGEMVALLTPAEPWLRLDALDAIAVGPADPGGQAGGPFAVPDRAGLPAATWRIGLLHAAPGSGPGEVSPAGLESSGLDFAALGNGREAASGRAGGTAWAVPGPPERTDGDGEAPGSVTLVTLGERGGAKAVDVETRTVGTVRRRTAELDAGTLSGAADLAGRLRAMADADTVLVARVLGERPDALDLDAAAAEAAVRDLFLAVRVEDLSRPALTTGPLPPPETVAGAFIRSVEGRIADLEASAAPGGQDEAAELREVLRLGRRLLAGAEALP